MPSRSTLSWLILLLFLFQTPLRGAEPVIPRLAILSEPEVRDLGAMLTATLSKEASLEILERDELSKLGDERKLTSLIDSNPLALQEIVGVEGLLFLSKTGDRIRVRLTGVKLGFTLFDLIFQPNAPPEEIAAKIESQLHRLASKLLIPPDKAIPLSILNLRAEEANKEGSRVERDLTLLLEVQLAHLPEVIVLERRQAGSLAFERGLGRETPDLLRGLFLIDGMFSLSSRDGAISMVLNVRPPGSGQLQEIKGTGKTDDLAALAGKLAASLTTLLKATPAPQKADWSAESREYFHEGLWAHRNHLYREAIAALDSAELLGETAADLYVARGFAACHRFTGERIWPNNRNHLESPPEAEEGISLIEKAMADEKSYRRAGGKKMLQTDLRKSPNYTQSELKIQITLVASLFLAHLEKLGQPHQHELRQSIRDYVNFNPIEGKTPDEYSTIKDAPLWAYSQEELMTFYELFLKRYPIRGNSLQIWLKPDSFCERFIPKVEDRRKAYFAFVTKLANEPGTRVRGLLFRAQQTSGEERDQTARELYAAMRDQQETLIATNQLGYFLKYCFTLEEKRKAAKADPLLLNVFQYFLENATPKNTFFHETWQPALFSNEAAPLLWEAMQGYQKRVLAVKPREDFRGINAEYARHFKAPGETRAIKNLHLDRYWDAPDTKDDRFVVTHYYPTPEGVRLIGVQAKNAPEVCDITLPGMAATRQPLGLQDYLKKIVPDGERLLAITTRNREDSNRQLAIFDPGSQEWTTHDIRNDATHLHLIREKIYYTFGSGFTSESGIAIFDLATGTDTLVTNSRRRPAKNQFEDQKGYFIKALFENYDGKAVVAIEGKAHVIDETSNHWSPLLDFVTIRSQCRSGKRTYLHASVYLNKTLYFMGIMIEPGKPEPELWYSELPEEITALPDYGKLPSWATKPRWRASPRSANYYTQFAIHGEDLFQFTEMKQEKELRLSIFRKDHPAPSVFNLTFSTPESLKRYNQASDAEAIYLTQSMSRMILTPQGLCFHPAFSGFWFISFEELLKAEKG